MDRERKIHIQWSFYIHPGYLEQENKKTRGVRSSIRLAQETGGSTRPIARGNNGIDSSVSPPRASIGLYATQFRINRYSMRARMLI